MTKRLLSLRKCQGRVQAVGSGVKQVREKTGLLESIEPCQLLAHLAMQGSIWKSERELPRATIPKLFSGQKPDNTDSEPQEVQTYYLTLTQPCKTQGACLTFICTSEQPDFCAINPKEYFSVQTNCFCSLVYRDGVKKHYKSLMAFSWKKHLLRGLVTSPPPPDLFPHLPHQWWINQPLMLSPLWDCWS